MKGTAVVAIGHGSVVDQVFARMCTWCKPKRFFTEADRIAAESGAKITHGMCTTCYREQLEKVEELK